MKRKLLKTTLIVVIAVSLCLSMIGCSQQTPEAQESSSAAVTETTSAETATTQESTETVTLGLALQGLTSEYGRLLGDAEVAACEKMGFEYELMDPDFDVNTQINQIETLITNQVDGILLTPVDADATVAACEKIYDAGIPCVVVNTLVNTDKFNAYVGSDDVTVGEDVMNWIAEQIGEKGNIVVMQGQLGMSAEAQRTEGIQKALENYPDINVLAMETANWRRDDGLALMENWLQTFGDQIDAVIAENDEMGIGAMQAVIAQNMDKKIYIAGVDGLEDALNAIKDGTYDCTFLQNAEKQGAGGVETMAKILNGESYDKEVWIPFERVTKENVDQYLS